MIGKMIGEGDKKQAKFYYKHLMITGLMIYLVEIFFLLQFKK